MVSIRAVSSCLPPLPKKFWRLSAVFTAVGLLAACGAFDYSVDKQDFRRDHYKERTLGNVYLNYDDSSDPYEMGVRRIHRGYAVHAPIYDSEDKVKKTHTRVHFTTQRTKDYKWFSGLQLRYEF